MDNRTPLIAGNWKMHKTSSEAVETAGELVKLVADTMDVDIMIAPVFTALEPVSKVVKNSRVGLGAQNLHWEKEGAYTGEISADMLISAGCQYVIIGHSERRHVFGEDDVMVNKRMTGALHFGLVPILCIGEKIEEREAGKTFTVLEKQVREGMTGIQISNPAGIVIAYEPVWAIGTGKTATPKQAQDVHAAIRALVAARDATIAAGVLILYGGSMKPANAGELLAMPDIDGGLIGGASLDAAQFLAIFGAAAG